MLFLWYLRILVSFCNPYYPPRSQSRGSSRGQTADESGVVVNRYLSATKFLLYFSKVSKAARFKHRSNAIEKQRAAIQAQEEEKKRKLQEQFKKLEENIDVSTYTEAAMISAMDKVRSVAVKYEKGGRSPQLTAFQGSHCEPGVFRDLCRKVSTVIDFTSFCTCP